MIVYYIPILGTLKEATTAKYDANITLITYPLFTQRKIDGKGTNENIEKVILLDIFIFFFDHHQLVWSNPSKCVGL